MTDIDDDWDEYDPDGEEYDPWHYERDDSEPDDDGDDRYDEFKDDLAMGYINRDGSQREPDPPDDPWDYPGRRPSFRGTAMRLLRAARWRLSSSRRRQVYDEPPF